MGTPGATGATGATGGAGGTLESATLVGDAGSQTTVERICSGGKKAISVGSTNTNNKSITQLIPLEAAGDPAEDGDVVTGWKVVLDGDVGNSAHSITIYVVCA